MTMFSKQVQLVDVSVTQSSNGAFTESRVETNVFANMMNIGVSNYVAAMAAGLHADAEIQLRSACYGGQEMVKIDNVEYNVERVMDTGEFTRLTLSRRAHNA